MTCWGSSTVVRCLDSRIGRKRPGVLLRTIDATKEDSAGDSAAPAPTMAASSSAAVSEGMRRLPRPALERTPKTRCVAEAEVLRDGLVRQVRIGQIAGRQAEAQLVDNVAVAGAFDGDAPAQRARMQA